MFPKSALAPSGVEQIKDVKCPFNSTGGLLWWLLLLSRIIPPPFGRSKFFQDTSLKILAKELYGPKPKEIHLEIGIFWDSLEIPIVWALLVLQGMNHFTVVRLRTTSVAPDSRGLEKIHSQSKECLSKHSKYKMVTWEESLWLLVALSSTVGRTMERLVKGWIHLKL